MENINFWLRVVRNILKIILLVLLILYFLGIDIKDVFAVEGKGWYNKIQYFPTNTVFYNPNNNTVISSQSQSKDDLVSWNVTTSSITNTNMKVVTFANQRLKKGYMYSVAYYFCSSNNMNLSDVTLHQFSSSSVTSQYGYTWSYSNVTNLAHGDTEIFTGGLNYGVGAKSCQVVTGLVVPSADDSWFGLYFKSSTALGWFHFMGFSIQELGLSSDSVQSIIDGQTSDLKKYISNQLAGIDTSSVIANNNQNTQTILNQNNSNKQQIINNQNSNANAIQSNQNSNTQAQISNDNKNHKELMDDSNINVNTNEINQITGLFPPGPVDSLLNIPFTVTSKIVNSLSGSCSPISVPTIGGYTLEFPCLGEKLYSGSFFNTYIMNFIGVVPASLILISYFKRLYKKVDRATSMNANADDEWGVI